MSYCALRRRLIGYLQGSNWFRLPGRKKDEMIQVVLEVRAGITRFRVAARATSIQRAASIAGARYPGGEGRLVVPVEPETFLAEATLAEKESVAVQMPE